MPKTLRNDVSHITFEQTVQKLYKHDICGGNLGFLFFVHFLQNICKVVHPGCVFHRQTFYSTPCPPNPSGSLGISSSVGRHRLKTITTPAQRGSWCIYSEYPGHQTLFMEISYNLTMWTGPPINHPLIGPCLAQGEGSFIL